MALRYDGTARRSLLAGALATFAAAVLFAAPAMAGEAAAQQRFASPQEAVTALVTALKDGDDSALLTVLGPDAEDLAFSGDPVADRNGRARFLEIYAEKNTIEEAAAGVAVLVIGSSEYPFPIPVVREGDAWRFDVESGRDEILNRRIGRNELHTIEVMRAYTAAQREYACLRQNGGRQEFAQRFASSPGEKDGLYWETGEGEAPSPFGPLIARAAREGYRGGLDEDPPEAFHGYYFKILKEQGEHAAGGAFNYVVDGRMVLGFALVAYPARYEVSGVMTFIVNQEGAIYEQDLGEETGALAAAMVSYDPDPTWRRLPTPATP